MDVVDHSDGDRHGGRRSEIPSVDFHDVLEEGLCFGWSESNRRAGDAVSGDAERVRRWVESTPAADRNLNISASVKPISG